MQQEANKLDQEERTTAFGLWRYSEAYLQAAKHLLTVQDDLNFNSPIYFLYAHAIELALKAHLRRHGATLGDLRGYGHALLPLLERARKKGLATEALTKNDESLIEMLDVHNREHEFRYIVTGFKRLPELNALQVIAERIVAATRVPV